MNIAPRERGPRRLPLAATEFLAWTGALAYPVLLCVTAMDEREPTGVRLLPFAALAVLALPLVRRRPLPALLLILAGSFPAVVTSASAAARQPFMPGFEGPGWQLATLQALLSYAVVGRIAAGQGGTARTATAAVLALGTHVALVGHYRTGADNHLSSVMFLVLGLAATWTTAHLIHERREHAETVRAEAAAHAVTAERLRIARELHDMVAHSIGAIAIQAGVGRRVIAGHPDEAKAALAAIETTSRDTLAGLRHMLGALRHTDSQAPPLDPAPTLADLGRLVATARDAGVHVDIEFRGERRPLPADLEAAGFRIVQESITNVIRHAATPRCRVVVDYGDGALSLTVTDDGRGRGTPGHGYGITGMRERAALLRGRCTAGPRPGGGFEVAARLPVPVAAR
ncbi:sensor histidine kinase [Streptomyces uncialis]|uniref:sensor histidine kinase n=1 Tax=Streptomyces uncialis TaxID=1048205 RepID=UPI00378D0C74